MELKTLSSMLGEQQRGGLEFSELESLGAIELNFEAVASANTPTDGREVNVEHVNQTDFAHKPTRYDETTY